MLLSQFPNYSNAIPVEESNGVDLDPQTFQSTYVNRSKPLVVRGAASQWPACQLWNIEILKSRMKSIPNIFAKAQGMVTKPMREYAGKFVGEERIKLAKQKSKMSAVEFLSLLEEGKEASAYAVSFKTPGIKPLIDDIGSLSFLDAALEKSGFLYSNRLFLYRGGFTDWHFHYADDGVTIQVMGRKEFLLLPNNSKVFEPLWGFSRHRGSWEMTKDDIFKVSELRPYKVILEPGDALFIPVFWWHAVEPCDKEIGATVALVKKAPRHIQFDPRLPGARWNMTQCLTQPGFKKYFPLFVLAGCWPLSRYPLRPPYLARD